MMCERACSASSRGKLVRLPAQVGQAQGDSFPGRRVFVVDPHGLPIGSQGFFEISHQLRCFSAVKSNPGIVGLRSDQAIYLGDGLCISLLMNEGLDVRLGLLSSHVEHRGDDAARKDRNEK